MNPLDFSTISFPVLGLELNPPRTLSLGPLSIHLYGLMIALGISPKRRTESSPNIWKSKLYAICLLCAPPVILLIGFQRPIRTELTNT